MRAVVFATLGLALCMVLRLPLGQLAGQAAVLVVAVIGLSLIVGAQKLVERLTVPAIVLGATSAVWPNTTLSTAKTGPTPIQASTNTTVLNITTGLTVLLLGAVALLIAAKVRSLRSSQPHVERPQVRRRARVVEPVDEQGDPWGTAPHTDDDLHLFREDPREPRR